MHFIWKHEMHGIKKKKKKQNYEIDIIYLLPNYNYLSPEYQTNNTFRRMHATVFWRSWP